MGRLSRICLILLLVICAVALFGDGRSFAADRGRSYGCTKPDDTARFPYGFMCGTHPGYYSPLLLTVTDGAGNAVNSDGDLNSGTYRVEMSWGSGVTGSAMRDGNNPATQSLAFVTMNTGSSEADAAISANNPSPAGGFATDLCPGDDSGNPGRHGKIWGDRDTTGSYSVGYPANQNRNDESPYAYNPDTNFGVINCQDHGEMAYWTDGRPSSSGASYSFDLNVNTAGVTRERQVCLRANLSIQFSGDARWFPNHSNDYSDPPGSTGAAISVAENQSTTATHLVKQSDVDKTCFYINPPSLPGTWKATLIARCDPATGMGTISGRIRKYLASGSLDPAAPQTTYTLYVLDTSSGSPVQVSLGNGTTAPSTNVYSVPINGDALFGNGTTRYFQLRHGSVATGFSTAGWDRLPQYSSGTGYFGRSASCHKNPPTLSVSGKCEDSIYIAVGLGDINSSGPIRVRVLDEYGNVIHDENHTSGFSLAMDAIGYQNGYPHTFSVTATDLDYGLTTGPATLSTYGCGRFDLQPRASGDFDTGDPENATQYVANNRVDTTYPGWANPSRPAVPSVYSHNITKTPGGVVAGPVGGSDSYNSFNTYPLTTNIASINAGDQYCTTITVGQAGSTTRGARGIIREDGVVLKITQDQLSDTNCDTIHNKPYFKTYGNGVSAGGEFQSVSGACSGGGTLASWNNNSGAYPIGAGSLLSALATGQIVGFGSSQRPSGGNPADRLTFANDTAPDTVSPSPKIGGNFASASSCFTAVDAPDGTPTTPSPGTLNIASYPDGAYIFNGDLTIHSGDIGLGEKKTFIVNGDVYIDGPGIRYTGTWTSPDNVPAVVIKANGGSIKINNSVRQLDGLYVAVKDSLGSKGKIYTCATDAGPITAGQYVNCANQLVVHGAFVADQVNLMRTFGSLRDEAPAGGGGPLIGFAWADRDSNRPAGYSCTRIIEPEPTGSQTSPPYEPWDHYWQDNWLCVPPASGVILEWINNPAVNSAAGALAETKILNPDPTKSFCAPLQPAGEMAAWNNDYLCSNKNLSFVTDGNKASAVGKTCATLIYESSDPDVGGLWQIANSKVWLCEPTPPATTPPATFTCSGRNPTKYFSRVDTCAAEVFDFSPDLYISNPKIKLPGNGAQIYDSITSLPPVL